MFRYLVYSSPRPQNPSHDRQADRNPRGQQFHYTPLTPGLSIRESMTAYEKTYAELARLKKGMRVLDLGCGIGGPARTIASTVGCTIVGITNNAWHIERGTALTKKAGLGHLVTLVQGDFLVRTLLSPKFQSSRAVTSRLTQIWINNRNCPSPTSPLTPPTRSSRCVTRPTRPRSTARLSAC